MPTYKSAKEEARLECGKRNLGGCGWLVWFGLVWIGFVWFDLI
jgi:hypothetical protein